MEPPLPLAGFRVLDLTRFLAGPYCSMVLADLGADVIKLEQPDGGDDSRRYGPMINGESYSFLQVNRGKRSVALDLKDPRGRSVAQRLAGRADLVMESLRPGVADRLGLGYEAVRALRPDVLYCSISGFGQTGPSRSRPGFDIMAQGATGLMRMTGQPDGRPAKAGIAVNDLAAGMTAVQAILAAQLVRSATGTGQYIDIALTDALLAWTVWEAGAWFGGAARWLSDPRFASPASRMAHIDELEAEIEAVTTARGTAHWLAALDAAGVPAGPVLRYDEALADPQTTAREMIVEMDHPLMGRVRTLGQPAKFSRSRTGAYDRPAPWLGQHTTQVLGEVGLTDAEISELTKDGVGFDAHPEAERDARPDSSPGNDSDIS
jgi:crotonobetainyl-CoA:carnitine CoA-transferase CaiB-like acyl-CoA transferase